MLQQEFPQDYVLATGVAISVREFTERVFKEFGIAIRWSGNGVNEKGVDQDGNVLVQIDPLYYRPTEVPFLLGDSSKARKELGWSPKYNLENLIHEMVQEEKRANS
jgi:GDPmannose 4,6-dehydratase